MKYLLLLIAFVLSGCARHQSHPMIVRSSQSLAAPLKEKVDLLRTAFAERSKMGWREGFAPFPVEMWNENHPTSLIGESAWNGEKLFARFSTTNWRRGGGGNIRSLLITQEPGFLLSQLIGGYRGTIAGTDGMIVIECEGDGALIFDAGKVSSAADAPLVAIAYPAEWWRDILNHRAVLWMVPGKIRYGYRVYHPPFSTTALHESDRK